MIFIPVPINRPIMASLAAPSARSNCTRVNFNSTTGEPIRIYNMYFVACSMVSPLAPTIRKNHGMDTIPNTPKITDITAEENIEVERVSLAASMSFLPKSRERKEPPPTPKTPAIAICNINSGREMDTAAT